LKVIGQFSHDGIGCKTRIKFVSNHDKLEVAESQSPTTVLFGTTLTWTITLYELLFSTSDIGYRANSVAKGENAL